MCGVGWLHSSIEAVVFLVYRPGTVADLEAAELQMRRFKGKRPTEQRTNEAQA